MQSFDAKSRYAVLAALDLAAHQTGKPVKLREIAARTGAPANYLVHVLLGLKRHALVRSTRGPAGGYALLRPPEVISVAEIVAAVSPQRHRPPAHPAASDYAAVVDGLLRDAEGHRRQFLARVTLAELLAQVPTV